MTLLEGCQISYLGLTSLEKGDEILKKDFMAES